MTAANWAAGSTTDVGVVERGPTTKPCGAVWGTTWAMDARCAATPGGELRSPPGRVKSLMEVECGNSVGLLRNE